MIEMEGCTEDVVMPCGGLIVRRKLVGTARMTQDNPKLRHYRGNCAQSSIFSSEKLLF